jgi:hypothetical protein
MKMEQQAACEKKGFTVGFNEDGHIHARRILFAQGALPIRCSSTPNASSSREGDLLHPALTPVST